MLSRVLSSGNLECILYRVYGDESHDEKSSRVFSVAGVFGSERDWEELDLAWADRIGGKIFHAADCEANRGDFSAGSDIENKRLYKDLTHLLCRSRLMGRGHAIDLVGWKRFFPDLLEDVPYYTCFRNVVRECGTLALLSIPQDKVEFTFDQRKESNYNAGVLYSYMTELTEWKASHVLHGKIGFDSRATVGIQAADLIARETMKHLDNIVGPVKRRTRRSMAALNVTGRFRFTFWMTEWFEGFRRDFERVAASCGVDTNEYRLWLDGNGLTDNISNRHRHMLERYPPNSSKLES
jgi:hypothetical protein